MWSDSPSGGREEELNALFLLAGPGFYFLSLSKVGQDRREGDMIKILTDQYEGVGMLRVDDVTRTRRSSRWWDVNNNSNGVRELPWLLSSYRSVFLCPLALA